MRTITTTEDLAAFCAAAKDHPYVTIDTEFLRERTYWSKLCLIQMALPGKTGDAVLVDVNLLQIQLQDLSLFVGTGGVFDPTWAFAEAGGYSGFV